MKRFMNVFLLSGLFILGLAGCRENRTSTDDPGLLVVERERVDFGLASPVEFGALMDIPQSGPEFLQDSIVLFLNRQMYEFCEAYCSETKVFEDVYDDYGGSLLSSFYDAYAPAFQPDDLPAYGQMSCLMVAQTESFLTYAVEYAHCGGSCGSELFCYTFSKKDGHLIEEVQDWDALSRVLLEHPEVQHPYEDFQLERLAQPNASEVAGWRYFDAALLEDGLLLVNEDAGNHYKLALVPYDEVRSSLSGEALELIGALENQTRYSYADWCVGECIGQVVTKNDKTVYLMERPPLWWSFADFVCVDDFPIGDKDYTLTAYVYGKNGKYAPTDVFPKSVMTFEFPEVAWVGPSPLRDEHSFSFDDATGMLYVPYQKSSCEVEYAPYKYDGKRFVAISEKEYEAPAFQEIAVLMDEWLFEHREDAVHLFADCREEDCVVIRSYVIRDGLYIPKEVFPDREGYSSSVKAMWSHLSTSLPDGEAYAFDEVESKLYLAYVEKMGMSLYESYDRFRTYQFNGSRFVYTGVDGGFWLHPSIREFAALEYLGQSDGYLVRVDAMRMYNDNYEDQYEAAQRDTCRYRYAAWSYGENMSSAPELIVENGRRTDEGFIFENEGCKYVVGQNLRVFKGNRLFTDQPLRAITVVDENE